MTLTKNIIIAGKHNKPIVADVHYEPDSIQRPILIFCHGYKGFKDWGAWDLMAEAFSKSGICFIKFNFSHNGGTVEQPIDFPDLEAFGANNYTKELDDLDTVISWVKQTYSSNPSFNTNNISLLGHSRGGGIVSIKAEEDSRIKTIISLAGVSDYKSRFPNEQGIKLWKKKAVMYVENGRTKQQMPHYFQFFEDFKKNEKRLSIQRAVSKLKIPHLIIHGDEDTSVSIQEAHKLHLWNPNSSIKIIEGANHVFGTSHPWVKKELSNGIAQVCDLVIALLDEQV